MNQEAKSRRFQSYYDVRGSRFAYPNGKIDIPGDAKSRDGGVKYTDYACVNCNGTETTHGLATPFL
jgi:hypothetical protein